MTDQQDDIEDDVAEHKCTSCGMAYTRHLGIIAICRQYLETVEKLERVTKERDEARIEICARAITKPDWQRSFAIGRGWDCFKEPNL